MLYEGRTVVFYIKFHVKNAGFGSRVARVSIDNGPRFNVRDGEIYRMPDGMARTLKIYQGKTARSRKRDAWTIRLSGQVKEYCEIDIFPYKSDPRATGAPRYTYYQSPAARYREDLLYASANMSKGKFDRFMRYSNHMNDTFARDMRKKSLPIPRSHIRPSVLLVLGAISGIATAVLYAMDIYMAWFTGINVTMTFFSIYILYRIIIKRL